MMDFVFMFALLGCGVAAGFIAGLLFSRCREEPSEPPVWTEEAYEPHHDKPRAVTRIHSNELDWEIK